MTSSSLSVPQEVVVNTRSVLLSSVKGVCLKRFNKDYKTLVGKWGPGDGCRDHNSCVVVYCNFNTCT